MAHLHAAQHVLTTRERTEQILEGDKEAEAAANRKINGPAFELAWTRYKADPIGGRAAFDEYLTMVTAFAEVLADRAGR